MLQAITTRYLGPTNTKESRIKASAFGGSVIIALDYALTTDENHAAAARALAEKFRWGGYYVVGRAPDGRGNVYINTTGQGAAFIVKGRS